MCRGSCAGGREPGAWPRGCGPGIVSELGSLNIEFFSPNKTEKNRKYSQLLYKKELIKVLKKELIKVLKKELIKLLKKVLF